jgi:hypothetical protein
MQQQHHRPYEPSTDAVFRVNIIFAEHKHNVIKTLILRVYKKC